jgi:hypothetical protein
LFLHPAGAVGVVHDKDVNHLEKQIHTHSIFTQGHGACMAGVSFYPTDVVCYPHASDSEKLSIIIQAFQGHLHW